jgi:hypothetical protein
MQSAMLSGAAAALALLACAPAFAEPPTQAPFRGVATLATPISAPTNAVVAGVTWRCEADTCIGTAARRSTLDNPVRECRKVAAAVGPLAGYTTRGRELSKLNLNACNVAAAKAAGESLVAQK